MIDTQSTQIENKIENNDENKKDGAQNNKFIILDTSNFIKLKPLNLADGWKYFTTNFIVNEIKDEQARDFYNLNKDFIGVKNPTKESMKFISNFAKSSNDLGNLSIPDLSILALAYDLIKSAGQESLLRNEPIKFDVVEKVQKIKKEEKKVENLVDEEGFTVVKSKNKKEVKKEESEGENDEGEWITPENINTKIKDLYKVTDILNEINNDSQSVISIFLSSSDFTVQNLALKIGIPVMSIDGMVIKKIKNYILKCYTCNNFIFDTTKLFCENCGYPTLMKIGCSISINGKLTIYDKPAEARNRGTQFNLPNPTLDKKAAVYILSEDQLPKKKIDVEKDIDKLLDNYEGYKDFKPSKLGDAKTQNTTKNMIWGYPKKNPNVAKKYYAKKQKK